MKFYVCGYLFDNYVYLPYKKEDGFFTAVGDKLRNGKWRTFVCYDYLISLLKIRKYDVDSLREVCERYTSDSYIWRVVHQSAKTCFESALLYLKMEEYSCSDVESELVDMFCFRCVKRLVARYNLFSDLCFKKMISCINILIAAILVETFSDTKNCLVFCVFCFGFLFGYSIGDYVLYYLLIKKREKIRVEIDIAIKNYESSTSPTPTHEFLHPQSLQEKKNEGYEYNLMAYHDDLKYEEFIKNMGNHFFNAKIVTFDIIHHECQGHKLKNPKRYYKTIQKQDFKIYEDDVQNQAMPSAIKS